MWLGWGCLKMACSIAKFGLSWGVTHYGLAGTFLEASLSHQIPLPQAQKASFLPAQHFGNLLYYTTYNIFQAAVCIYVCVRARVCIVLIYILTRFKSTPLSAIIITHLVKGSAQFFLYLRRAAAGVAHRRPANTPPALPRIQTASAYTQSHCLPWCNGAFLLDSNWTEYANSSTGKWVSKHSRNKAVGIGRTGNKDSRALFYGCQRVRPHTHNCTHPISNT